MPTEAAVYTETTVQKLIEILGAKAEEEIRVALDVEKIETFEEFKTHYYSGKTVSQIDLETGLELAKTLEHCLFVHSCTSGSSSMFIHQIIEKALEVTGTMEEYKEIFLKIEFRSPQVKACIIKMAELIENPQSSEDSQVLKFKTS